MGWTGLLLQLYIPLLILLLRLLITAEGALLWCICEGVSEGDHMTLLTCAAAACAERALRPLRWQDMGPQDAGLQVHQLQRAAA